MKASLFYNGAAKLFTRRSQCEDKKKYTARSHAEKDARKITKHKNIEFHAYFCWYCKKFHVGS